MRGVRRKGNVKSASQSDGTAMPSEAMAQQCTDPLGIGKALTCWASALRRSDLQGNGKELCGVTRTAAAKQIGAMIRRGLADPGETKSGSGDAWHGDAGAKFSTAMRRLGCELRWH